MDKVIVDVKPAAFVQALKMSYPMFGETD